MATSLTAWKFDTVDGADRALAVLKSLEAQRIVTLQDGAIVRWDEGKRNRRPSSSCISRVRAL